mgnify:CR=1 FL=1
MTQQQIIEESNYLAIQFADADIDVRDAIKTGFQYAANWRIDSVWHDVSEKPNGMFVIIIDFGNEISPEEFGLGMTSDDLNGAKRWAYISDLLPERKEENYV